MLELIFSALITLLPDYIYRTRYQGKKITLFSFWYELRWGIAACVALTLTLITVIFYYHPIASNVISGFRTVSIISDRPGRVEEVYVSNDAVRIEKVWCAADPGEVLDPANFKAQMMSGIVYGLSQALGQEITFADGMVEQSNFTDFDAMRMAQCPVIEVAILENSPKMGGAGEPGTPPSVPALANAIFSATGKRIRQMPLSHAIDFA